jgi:uncharacterized protein (DUF1919 family)
MKSRTFLIAVTILISSLFSNVSAQNEKKDKSNITKFEQVQISYDMKDLVTVKYLNALAQDPWKMKVKVYTESGKLLDLYASRKKGNARIGYDISQYPAGNYTFDLYKNRVLVYSKSIVKQVSIAKANKKLNLKSNLTNFQQVQINYDMKDLVTIEYLDALAQSPWKMKVRIYKESGKLLDSYVSRKKGNTKVGYDISQYPAGKYTFEIYKNHISIGLEPIIKQANKDSKLIGQEYSTNELLSEN